ncbi:Sodium-dependent glucose transporter 1 [Folsomia candida]|uniref:Sodium-dependent glucose transporter 1 n=2 Tax=Folsomia candida TaxID=158441 RepID=A0A226EV66_FOLCA|nr:Sodium-dependent glucose transporter 1 [Folsomia candida]
MAAKLESAEPPQEKSPRPPHSKKLKYFTTIAIMLGNITFGCAFNFYSPALEDLRIKYETDVDDISRIFTILLVSYCCGALSATIIYRYVNRQLGVICCFCGMSVALFLTPHVESKIVFFVLGGVLGISIGAYDCAQVVWMIEMWQEKSGPFIQCQHFCYAIGSNIPPILMGPFLRDDNDDDELEIKKRSEMLIPFTVAGILCSGAFFMQLMLFIFCRYYTPPMYGKEIKVESCHGNVEFSIKNLFKFFGSQKFKLIVVMGCFAGAYQGMELTTLQFIPTFGQYSPINLSESTSAYVLTGSTGLFAIGRFLGIFIIMKVHPVVMLITSLAIVTTGNVILFFWAGENLNLFWLACCILGAGFSTMYASWSAFMEKYLVFTDAVGGALIVCGSLLAAVYPVIVGGVIERDTRVLGGVNFFSIGVCIGGLGVGGWVVRKGKCEKKEGGEECGGRV